eukprot:GHVT01032796.1.p1 GENE.GHVT01032796.1~~GHVT01032796.1.p1  ORF type:complete len:443 (-),score=66.91 GHVT01032796.1:318-1646(-)
MAKPLQSFREAGFPPKIQEHLEKLQFAAPTAIQQVSWPLAMTGRDLVGVAQTGSGKTLGYALPALSHIMAQEPVGRGEGPIALFLAPTRELAQQIDSEVSKLNPTLSLRSVCVYGGASRGPQAAALQGVAQLLVATPGRLLDFLESRAVSLRRVSYLVLDEADRMLDMGFEPQMRRLISQLRPDRQTLLFSATWPQEVQRLAKDFCRGDQHTIKIQVGSETLQANPKVKQEVMMVSEEEKLSKFLEWLAARGGTSAKVLVFCDTKKNCDAMCRELRYQNYKALAIHGDKEQRERERIIADYRCGRCKMLLATDVASRGLDIKEIEYVVNYNLPNTVEDYIHRIGRTARGDAASGTSLTFFEVTGGENADRRVSIEAARLARGICDAMRSVGQDPPEELLHICKGRPQSSGGSVRYNGYKHDAPRRNSFSPNRAFRRPVGHAH